MVLPVRISGQAKPLINSVPRCYPPPRTWSRLVALPPEPPTCLAWLSAASVASRCEPILAFPLLPGPSTCPARPSAASVASGCEPIPAFPLLPGLSTCPAWPSATPTSARCDSGSWSGTMAAGAREQAASCDAFVLSRRQPASDAPPIRTSPLCLIAKPFPEPARPSPPPRKNLRNHRRKPPSPRKTIRDSKNRRYPKKSAKNHENMAKRAKNVLLAISSGGGYFYIFVAMVKS